MSDTIDAVKKNRRVLTARGVPISLSDDAYNRLWVLAARRNVPLARVAAELIPDVAVSIDHAVLAWLVRQRDAAARTTAPAPAEVPAPALEPVAG